MLLAILKLSSEIAEGDLTTLDTGLLVAMRRMTGDSGPVIEALRWVTWLGNAPTLIAAVLLVVLGLLAARSPGRAAILWLGTAGGAAIVMLLKALLGRARPMVLPHLAQFSGDSFPSGHAADAAIVYLAIAALLAQTSTRFPVRAAILGTALLLVIAIGLSRLFLGVHWPTDVLAGWTFGASWALLCWTAGWWWRARRTGPLP